MDSQSRTLMASLGILVCGVVVACGSSQPRTEEPNATPEAAEQTTTPSGSFEDSTPEEEKLCSGALLDSGPYPVMLRCGVSGLGPIDPPSGTEVDVSVAAGEPVCDEPRPDCIGEFARWETLGRIPASVFTFPLGDTASEGIDRYLVATIPASMVKSAQKVASLDATGLRLGGRDCGFIDVTVDRDWFVSCAVEGAL